jgi:glycerol uptake facilitator-like aquaporin
MTSRRSLDYGLSRRLAAEGFGTLFLMAAVVGSGIMAARLTADTAVALLANAVATGAMLTVLITILGPVSGAHLNPAVSLVFALKGEMSRSMAVLYAAVQVGGGIAGTILAHAMFGLKLIALSQHARTGGGQWLAEWVASFGLVATILAGRRLAAGSVAWLVGLYITAAYWFTASTSFANPAVAIARALTDTFSGIRPADVPAFILAQLAGAAAALVVTDWLLAPAAEAATSRTGV